MNQANDVGESAQSISRRQDNKMMERVISALQDGAHLRIHTKVRRAAIEGLPDNDSRNGITISASRCKRMAKEGVIREVGMDRYAMADEFDLRAG
ncbi:hypothetical protein ACJO2E_08745 [Marinobacter sp. M1N3S26]|uniref:hypothetical protein n=1 Tax=Marinobacter sp. M1N3S26 TaxID=3382299 RepID=UPI00387B5A23